MVYTVSGLVLHRLRRMARVGDVPGEAARVVGLMVAEVERLDPSFFGRVGDAPLEARRVVETRAARRPASATPPRSRPSTSRSTAARSRLVDWSARAPAVVADAVRHVLGRADLGDAEALALALDPAQQPLPARARSTSRPTRR